MGLDVAPGLVSWTSVRPHGAFDPSAGAVGCGGPVPQDVSASAVVTTKAATARHRSRRASGRSFMTVPPLRQPPRLPAPPWRTAVGVNIQGTLNISPRASRALRAVE